MELPIPRIEVWIRLLGQEPGPKLFTKPVRS